MGLGAPERDAMLDLLNDGHILPHQRLRAAEILLDLGERRAVPLVWEMADDATAPGTVRVDAAGLLLRHVDVLGRAALRDLLSAQDLSPGQRLAAAELLGAEATAGPLSELAADPQLDQQIRRKAIEMLACHPDSTGELTRLASAAEDDLWLWTRALTLLATIDREALHGFFSRSQLDMTRRLWLAELLRTHGSTVLYEAATDRHAGPAERAAAAHRLLTKPHTVSSEQLNNLVRSPDLPKHIRRTAVQVLCRRTSELTLIQAIATDRDLEPPYRAWAAWTLAKDEHTSEALLVAIAADREIDDLIRLPALDRVTTETLRGFVLDRDQPGELRDAALTGMLRRNPPVVAGLLHTLITDQATENDLRGLALRTLLAADTAERTRLLETLADDERIEVSLRPHLRQAATQEPQAPEIPEEPEPPPPDPPEPPPEMEAGDRVALDVLAEFFRSAGLPPADQAALARMLAKAEEPAVRKSLVNDPEIDDTALAEVPRLLHDFGGAAAAAAALLVTDSAEGLRAVHALIEDGAAPAYDRVRAAAMLVQISQESGVASLLALLDEPDLSPDVREIALKALQKWGGAAGTDALNRIVRDKDATVNDRLSAAMALYKIDT